MKQKSYAISDENREAADRFFEILNNKGKMAKGSEIGGARSNGFVVLVRGARTLQELQLL
jgi:hypothetical protein